MGWCSGSQIWDDMFPTIMKMDITDEQKGYILKELFDNLKGMDWDCDEPTGIDWLDEILYPDGW